MKTRNLIIGTLLSLFTLSCSNSVSDFVEEKKEQSIVNDFTGKNYIINGDFSDGYNDEASFLDCDIVSGQSLGYENALDINTWLLGSEYKTNTIVLTRGKYQFRFNTNQKDIESIKVGGINFESSYSKEHSGNYKHYYEIEVDTDRVTFTIVMTTRKHDIEMNEKGSVSGDNKSVLVTNLVLTEK